MNSMALAMSLFFFSNGMQKSNEWQTRNSALHVCAGSYAFTVHMIVFANVVPFSVFVHASSRCQHSSWPSSSSSCRYSKSSSSICSTFKGKGCSRSSPDRLACHCTPLLRVSIQYHSIILYLLDKCLIHQSSSAQWRHSHYEISTTDASRWGLFNEFLPTCTDNLPAE